MFKRCFNVKFVNLWSANVVQILTVNFHLAAKILVSSQYQESTYYKNVISLRFQMQCGGESTVPLNYLILGKYE